MGQCSNIGASGANYMQHVCESKSHRSLYKQSQMPIGSGRHQIKQCAASQEGRTGSGQAAGEVGKCGQPHVDDQGGVGVHRRVRGVVQRLLAALPRVPRQEAHAGGDAAVGQGNPEVGADARRRRDACAYRILNSCSRGVAALLLCGVVCVGDCARPGDVLPSCPSGQRAHTATVRGSTFGRLPSDVR